MLLADAKAAFLSRQLHNMHSEHARRKAQPAVSLAASVHRTNWHQTDTYGNAGAFRVAQARRLRLPNNHAVLRALPRPSTATLTRATSTAGMHYSAPRGPGGSTLSAVSTPRPSAVASPLWPQLGSSASAVSLRPSTLSPPQHATLRPSVTAAALGRTLERPHTAGGLGCSASSASLYQSLRQRHNPLSPFTQASKTSSRPSTPAGDAAVAAGRAFGRVMFKDARTTSTGESAPEVWSVVRWVPRDAAIEVVSLAQTHVSEPESAAPPEPA